MPDPADYAADETEGYVKRAIARRYADKPEVCDECLHPSTDCRLIQGRLVCGECAEDLAG